MVLEHLTRRLQRTNKDQYTVTVPKALVELLGLKARDKISVSIVEKKLVLGKAVRGSGPKRKLQCTNKDQYTLTIPKALVQVLGLREQDVLVFGLSGSTITLQQEGLAKGPKARISNAPIPRGPVRRLQRTNKGQYTLTIPKQLVRILGLGEQDAVAFGLSGGEVTLQKSVRAGTTRKVQRTDKDQYTVTVPKPLVELLGLQEHDKLEFCLTGKIVTLRKRAGGGAK